MKLIAAIIKPHIRNGNSVYVIDKDSKLRSRIVQPLSIDQESVLIAQGISEGDRICISPLTQSSEGMLVNWIEETLPMKGGLVLTAGGSI